MRRIVCALVILLPLAAFAANEMNFVCDDGCGNSYGTDKFFGGLALLGLGLVTVFAFMFGSARAKAVVLTCIVFPLGMAFFVNPGWMIALPIMPAIGWPIIGFLEKLLANKDDESPVGPVVPEKPKVNSRNAPGLNPPDVDSGGEGGQFSESRKQPPVVLRTPAALFAKVAQALETTKNEHDSEQGKPPVVSISPGSYLKAKAQAYAEEKAQQLSSEGATKQPMPKTLASFERRIASKRGTPEFEARVEEAMAKLQRLSAKRNAESVETPEREDDA